MIWRDWFGGWKNPMHDKQAQPTTLFYECRFSKNRALEQAAAP